MPSLPQLGPRQIGSRNYLGLCVAVACQSATLLITWTLWQVREQPIHLPWLDSDGILALGSRVNWGPWLLGSLVLVLLTPRRWGMLIHLGVLLLAISGDQFRCQPQILGGTLLMAACVWEPMRFVGRWYLIAMWTWAGLHKLLSEDWFGSVTSGMLAAIPGMEDSYWWFAFLVAATELILGLLAMIRPRVAAVVCIGLHLGIVGFLLLVGWNYSVIPWNLATASIGAWITWTAARQPSRIATTALDESSRPQTALRQPWHWAIIGLLMLSPIGFYFGWLRHSFAHVLYSDNFALSAATDLQGVHEIEMMDQLAVPFPHTPNAFQDYFRLTGEPGDKLHIIQRRGEATDAYFRLSNSRQLETISAADFFSGSVREWVGVACDDPRSRFALTRAGARLLVRSQGEMIYAIEFQPSTFEAGLLPLLQGLPNLEQIQLADCPITNADLERLPVLYRLNFIGLDETGVTPQGLKELGRYRSLTRIEYMGSLIDGTLLENLLQRAPPGNPESLNQSGIPSSSSRYSEDPVPQ